MSDEAKLYLEGIGTVRVTRESPEESWTAEVACPVCAANGSTMTRLFVRAYGDEERKVGDVVEAPAWCRGRHDKPIGMLTTFPPEPGVLKFMGVQKEVFQCRIY